MKLVLTIYLFVLGWVAGYDGSHNKMESVKGENSLKVRVMKPSVGFSYTIKNYKVMLLNCCTTTTLNHHNSIDYPTIYRGYDNLGIMANTNK